MLVFGKYRRKSAMLGRKKRGAFAVFRRDWGNDAVQPIRRLETALDAITPSNDDCSMRVIITPNPSRIEVAISVYQDIYFTGHPLESHYVSLTESVLKELKEKKFIIPFSLTGAENSTIWLVSDDGETAWRALFTN